MKALRRLFVVTSPGLERSLERELQSLKIAGRLEVTTGGVALSGPEESLWRVALQSRLAELVLLRLGEPFHAPDLHTLDHGLRRLPWQSYLHLSPQLPDIKVSSERSRLYHTKMLAQRVAQCLRELPAEQLEVATKVPELRLRLRHDEAQVSLLATGLLHKRGSRKAVGSASMRETLAAACVLESPLLRRLAAAVHHGEELVLWDPFCGSGAILLEALEIVLGQPTGNHMKYFPFKSLPTYSSEDYERTAKCARNGPAEGLSKLTLMGSDQSAEQIERCKSNLRRCLRRLNGVETLEDLPCRVQLHESSLAAMGQRLRGRPTMIVTNVPFGVASGGKRDREAGLPEASETYSQLGRLLRQRKADWRGVYCLVAFPETFRSSTDLEWSSELRFLNGPRWVDLLSWSGGERR